MSETTEQTGSDAAPEQQSQTAGAETQQVEVSEGESAETQPVQQAAEQKETEQPTPKPKEEERIERRIANITRALNDERRARQAAEQGKEAAEALLRVNRQSDDGTAPDPTRQPASDVEERARQLVAEQDFNRRIAAIDTTGAKEFGAEWEAAKQTMTSLGAVDNPAFLQALAETENPARIFATLADDTDALVELLRKSPIALAAKLARMDADMSRPVTKPLSAAPAPAQRTQPSGVVKAFDPYNVPPGMSMKEWNREMDPHLPVHLGGKRKSG